MLGPQGLGFILLLSGIISMRFTITSPAFIDGNYIPAHASQPGTVTLPDDAPLDHISRNFIPADKAAETALELLKQADAEREADQVVAAAKARAAAVPAGDLSAVAELVQAIRDIGKAEKPAEG